MASISEEGSMSKVWEAEMFSVSGIHLIHTNVANFGWTVFVSVCVCVLLALFLLTSWKHEGGGGLCPHTCIVDRLKG